MHLVYLVLGVASANSRVYLFYSGVLSPLILGAALVYHRFTCDIPGCKRLGWRLQPLTGHSFCKIHDTVGKLEVEATKKKIAQGEIPE